MINSTCFNKLLRFNCAMAPHLRDGDKMKKSSAQSIHFDKMKSKFQKR
jgi:hypothetical protein